MRRLRISALLLFLVSQGVVFNVRAQYLTPEAFKLTNLVPAPPEDNSPAGLADMETMLRVQDGRTPEQVERAKRVDTQSAFSFARPVLGDWFHSKDFPRTAAVFDAINREAGRIIDASKKQWSRPRPYERSKEMTIVVGHPGNASYPSGHTAIAAVWAAVFSAAFPEDAVAFQKQVHEVMWCRVIGGVHFPSDTTAGEILGDAIGREILAGPEIKKAIQILQGETAPYRKKE
jgi:acid phosphatase (class A)